MKKGLIRKGMILLAGLAMGTSLVSCKPAQPPVLTGIEVTAPTKTEYTINDTIDLTGMVVTAVYSDESKEVVESGYTVSDVDFSTVGDKTVTVTYEEKTASFTISVVRRLTGIKLTSLPTKVIYEKGEVFKSDGLEVTATYNTEEEEVISSGYTLSTPDMSENDSEQEVTVTYQGFEASFSIYIGKALLNLTVYDPYKTAYFLGDEFDPTGMYIDANYSDGTKATLKFDASAQTFPFEYTIPDLSTLGGKEIVVSYHGKSATSHIAVLENDYVHSSDMQFDLDYEGHDFFKDGVGEFELYMTIDGDTAHFTPLVKTTSSETVKVRFYGVDTPESTGRIQEYGQQASNFTKRRLKEAAANGTIVLAGVSSEYAVPTMDANGRYLCCVWINESVKHCSPSELVNLNLWIVQEGYSYVGSLDKMPEYADVFNDAYWQARNNELKLHSGRPDPYFNYGEYIPTDVPAIMKEVYKNLNDPTHAISFDGEKVKLVGTVVGYANNSIYLQKFDAEEEKYYSINIFCGMTRPAEKYLVPGTVIDVCGVAKDSENFGFQITGAEGHFPILESKAKEDDVHILVKAAANTDPETMLKTFEYTPTELDSVASSYVCLNSAVALEGTITANKCSVSQDGKKFTIRFSDVSFDLYLTSAFAGDPDKPNDTWTTTEEWQGKKIAISNGIFTYHSNGTGAARRIYFQIVVTSAANIAWVK